jgi:NAD(P)H-hydrate epimerase
MATLLGITPADVEADRTGAAHRASARFQAIIVLKGSRTLVVAPDGRWAVALQPNPALAKAGMGDVLTGITGALLAQGLAPFDAARLAVTAHAAAGRRLQAQFGNRAGMASDLVQLLAPTWQGFER